MKSIVMIVGLGGCALGITFTLVQQPTFSACSWHVGLTAVLTSVLLPWSSTQSKTLKS